MKRRWIIALVAALLPACALVAGIDEHHLAPAPSGSDADSVDAVSPNVDGSTAEAAAGDATVDALVDGGPDGSNRDAAITFVQAHAGSVLNASSHTIALPSPVRANSTIVIAFSIDGDDTNFDTVSDNAGNTYFVSQPYTALNQVSRIAVARNAVLGTVNVTINLVSTSPEIETYLHEYAGLSDPALVITQATVTDSCGDGEVDCMVSGPMEAANPISYLIFGYGFTGVADAGTGFTARSHFNSNVTEDRMIIGPQSQVQATATKISGSSAIMIGALLAGY